MDNCGNSGANTCTKVEFFYGFNAYISIKTKHLRMFCVETEYIMLIVWSCTDDMSFKCLIYQLSI